MNQLDGVGDGHLAAGFALHRLDGVEPSAQGRRAFSVRVVLARAPAYASVAKSDAALDVTASTGPSQVSWRRVFLETVYVTNFEGSTAWTLRRATPQAARGGRRISHRPVSKRTVC